MDGVPAAVRQPDLREHRGTPDLEFETRAHASRKFESDRMILGEENVQPLVHGDIEGLIVLVAENGELHRPRGLVRHLRAICVENLD